MGRRILNRKEMRNDFDAAERRGKDEEETEEEETDEEEEEEGDDDEGAEGDDESEEEDEEDSGEDDEDEEGEGKRKKKKPKPKAPAKPKAKSRARVAKVVRMRVLWGVYNNSNQLVASYDFPKRADAEAHAAKLTADKKSTHFIQQVREAIEEKDKKEK